MPAPRHLRKVNRPDRTAPDLLNPRISTLNALVKTAVRRQPFQRAPAVIPHPQRTAGA